MSTVAGLLKEQTQDAHTRVEVLLDLLSPDLSAARLATVIERLSGFWAGTEPGVDEWSKRNPELGSAVQWGRRSRTALFAHDLRGLSAMPVVRPPLRRAPAVFAHVQDADVFGWLYVTEGSTLGGAVIDRHLRELPGFEGTALRCFTPYGEETLGMWRGYKTALEDFAFGDPTRTEAVVTAAVATFDALETWLAGLSSSGGP